jgi:hypothetical protein
MGPLADELRAMERQMEKLQANIERQEERLNAGRRVCIVHKGVGIQVCGTSYYPATEDITERGGSYYIHVKTGKFCTNTWTHIQFSANNQTNIEGFNTREEAVTKILDWIVTGVRP